MYGPSRMKNKSLFDESDSTRELLNSGAGMREIVQVASNDEIQIAQAWYTFREPCRNFKPEVRWYYGPTGVGKTNAALEWLGEDTYIAMPTSEFWDGYDKHQGVLLDDFRKDFMSFNDLLRFLDHRAYRLRQRYGQRQLLSTKIAITCPFSPKDLYKNLDEDVEQLVRRIDQVIPMGTVPLFSRLQNRLGCLWRRR